MKYIGVVVVVVCLFVFVVVLVEILCENVFVNVLLVDFDLIMQVGVVQFQNWIDKVIVVVCNLGDWVGVDMLFDYKCCCEMVVNVQFMMQQIVVWVMQSCFGLNMGF